MKWTRWITLMVIVLIALMTVTATACSSKAANQSPLITSLVAVPTSVAPGGSATVTCVATDPDGDALSYLWTFTGGSQSGTGDTITWVAPTAANTYTIKVSVSDGKGGVANSSITIVAAPTPTPAPTEGSIDIKSNPANANVIIDGIDTGSITPYVATHVSDGNHTVQLEYAHYKWHSGVVAVNGGETAYVNWALTYADEQTRTLQPDGTAGKDTWAGELYPDQKSGSLGWLSVGGGAGGQFRAYIQFDLSSIPSAAVVTEADLGLYYRFSTPGSLDSAIGVYKVTSSWNESLLTWNNQPAVNATVQDTVTVPASATNDFVNWTIIGLVRDWLSNTVANNGVMLRDTNESVYEGEKEFCSSGWTDSILHPKLVITYYDPASP